MAGAVALLACLLSFTVARFYGFLFCRRRRRRRRAETSSLLVAK
jgi:hypothetical protein